MPDATCRGCGEPLTPKGHHGGPPKTWCSGACQARWRRNNLPAYAERERVRKAARVQALYTPRQRAARAKLRAAKRGTRATYTWAAGWCPTCGEPFVARWVGEPTRYCSAKCRRRAMRIRNPEASREADHRRRARKRDAYVAPVHRASIYRRDRDRCQLCGTKVDHTKVVPHPQAPTIDHIVPLAAGGTHEPANVQLAHFICNARKGDRGQGPEQLRLIG